jgi:hypothetical protein
MNMIWKMKKWLPFAAIGLAVWSCFCSGIDAVYLAGLSMLTFEAAR